MQLQHVISLDVLYNEMKIVVQRDENFESGLIKRR